MVMSVTLGDVRERLTRHAPYRRREPPEPGSIQAAVALLLVPAGPGLEALLIKRADHPGDPWSGQMALPGGRRDPGDSDLLVTATRETREEVGVELSPDGLLGELDDLHPRTRTLPPVVVRPFVFGMASRPEIRTSREVALFLWAQLAEFADRRNRTEVPIPGHGNLPGISIGGHVVWGMTERIIRPFLDLLT
jgi:8-oxo-dGTP pyrophosphatase MutT (NUDIX family)